MSNPDSFDELEADLEADAESPDLLIIGAGIYAYSQSARRWVNASTGQFVPDITVINEMRRHVAATFDMLDSLTSQLYRGQITLGQWQIAVASELKDAHLAQSMFAVGGKTNMTAVEFGRVGGTLADEYRHLSQFADDIAAGRVSAGQAQARIQQYGKAAQQSFWKEYAAATTDLVNWVLHPADHCPDCVDLAAGSPYTMDTLPTFPGAGATVCRGNCHCTLERIVV